MTNDLHVSPSQLDTASHCMRRWGWDKIAHLPRGENKYAARGSAVHSILEDWLLHAKAPDLSDTCGKIAFSAIEHLPAPMTPGMIIESGGKNIEREFDGVWWSYRKDVKWTAPDGGVVIYDHKTCSNPDRYGHTPIGTLDRHPQPILYAFDELYDGAPWVRLQWNDMTTAKPFRTVPQVLTVGPAAGVATVPVDHVVTMFRAWNEFGRNLLTLRKKGVHPIKLPYDATHCQDYGSECPYAKHCNLTEQEQLRSLMTQATVPNDANAFLARLADMTKTAEAVAQAPVQAAVPAQAPAQAAPVFTPPAPAAMPAPTTAPNGLPVFAPPAGVAPANAGFQFPPPAVLVAAPVPTPAATPDVAQITHFETPVAVVPEAVVAPTVQQAPAEQPKRGRGRPKKAETVTITDPDTGDKAEFDVIAEAGRETPDWPCPVTIPAPQPDHTRPYAQDLVLAMATNPAYAVLDSVSLRNKFEMLLALAGDLV